MQIISSIPGCAFAANLLAQASRITIYRISGWSFKPRPRNPAPYLKWVVIIVVSFQGNAISVGAT